MSLTYYYVVLSHKLADEEGGCQRGLLDNGDELRWVKETTGENDIVISTSAGQATRFNEKEVRVMGRAAMGVRGMRLRPKDEIVGMDVITDPDQRLIVVSANGYGKLCLVANFPPHKRGGVGIKVASVTEKTGPIVAVHTLDPLYQPEPSKSQFQASYSTTATSFLSSDFLPASQQ